MIRDLILFHLLWRTAPRELVGLKPVLVAMNLRNFASNEEIRPEKHWGSSYLWALY